MKSSTVEIKRLSHISKVKSFTVNGEKAITRSFLFKEKNKDEMCIYFKIIYFDSTNRSPDEYIRSVGNKKVCKRIVIFKLDTLLQSLINLKIFKTI